MAGGDDFPMGAHLTATGATFRAWVPEAVSVAVRGSFNGWIDHFLAQGSGGTWWAEIPGVKADDRYKFHVVGRGNPDWKRDPYARELTIDPPFPHCDCIVTPPDDFPWHDRGFRPPPFHEFIIYQLHVGAFFARDVQGHDSRERRPGRFLDVIDRVEYLAALGVTAVQLLPIQEFPTRPSLGYNGTDYFSPEMDYAVAPDDPDFARHVRSANNILQRRGLTPYREEDLRGQAAQLKALIDLLHIHGIAVIFDLVYNHAGGDFDSGSLYFFDCQPHGDNNRSQFFTDKGWSGGLVFAFWRREVRQFLIDNARFLLDEYHVDGYRFDEVTVIDNHGGWEFLRDLTGTLRYHDPKAVLIAEYWADQSAVLRPIDAGGAGFDAVVDSGLREAVRGAINQAAAGAGATIDLDAVARALVPRHGGAWRSVHHLENHDIVRINNDTDRAPRIAELAGGGDPRSWYARSRARVANGLLLTAPGTPMLFMGQEFLENKYWSDNPQHFRSTLIWWDGLDHQAEMRDHLRFIRELVAVRKRWPALQSDPIHCFHVHNQNRVLAVHRWVPGSGRDVVVVVNLREETWWGYELGLPRGGDWYEIFNSDVYDHWVNPQAAGNGGRIRAEGPPRHGLPASASVVLPANGLIVFAVDPSS